MIHMTSRVLVSGLREHVGQTVSVSGWVNTLRLQRKMQFVVVRDHTGMVQVTHKRGGEGDEVETALEGLTPESAVRITGRVVDNPIVKLGGLEIIPESVEVLNRAETPLPIDEQTGLEHRLDWRFLDVRRRPQAQLLFAVQTTLEQGMREYAYGQGCTEMHTPKLMGTASESGAEVFKLGYFDRSAYLAQSPQFFKQMAISAGVDKVFEIGPVFRAEPSFTSRHATEFTGVDVELAWIDGVEDVMAFEERMLAHAIAKVADAHGEAIQETFGVEVTVPMTPFPRLTMAETQEILRAKGWDPVGVKEDLDPEGERGIASYIKEQTGHEWVFVTHYPTSIRPFYHMRPTDDPGVTLSFDLLWKGLEVTTGAQREHRYDVLLKQAAEKGMSTEPMQDYLNAFRYGCPPHGGLGMGLGRVLMVMLGLDSIREATFLFRGPNRLTP
ncbi:aspartate--tRNA(Asn) ligase [Streptomyces caniscabiei]|uniref:Aspartate--tRNA ligase n=1 Tax=Streptomyces caniscabiei TaxID=2746961 RepID=A0ABU4N0V9_9ACTN|nr:aspartate--tRNA(Asn) ligase [Streptomyces caniscabiei]MBE4741422.1 aspartate--tRNA(Asn) ligase [Streptomyces caniscabiei]MBE4761604.1 aspartate--tRNA(Asn) ligase [Streptomyces caniscabiei]MBE4789984.1 aspartate--tRNA(Asn) ligase [Streptomyces caniscabiei]MBE4799253.1 aspartate--tRNA(Asn) ligase [Streptomyces caniscabiei]MDX2947673.1 aspartate--tRNA(Asn) ligase [Streptomyces caniscabiei]